MRNKLLSVVILAATMPAFAGVENTPDGERWVPIADKPGLVRVDIYDPETGSYETGARYEQRKKTTTFVMSIGGKRKTSVVTGSRDVEWNWNQDQAIEANAGAAHDAASSADRAESAANDAAAASQRNTSAISQLSGTVAGNYEQAAYNASANKVNSMAIEGNTRAISSNREQIGAIWSELEQIHRGLDAVAAMGQAAIAARVYGSGMGVGFGWSGDESAMAVAIGHELTEQVSVNANVSTTNQRTSWGMGVNWKW